jgi:hypothetical protein
MPLLGPDGLIVLLTSSEMKLFVVYPYRSFYWLGTLQSS